jgi:pimeloyl-ACP methyl ester carboxylesterase
MKRITLFLFILGTFLLNVNAEKKVFYIHGTFANQNDEEDKIDNKHKLGSYRKTFSDNNGTLCWYESDNDLHSIGTYCFNTFVKPQEANNEIILVAHSMGGSVARTMLNKSPNIKGLITAGTANNGNIFFKKLANGEAWSFFEKMNFKGSNAVDGSKTGIANALLPGSNFASIVTQKVALSHNKNLALNDFFKFCFNELLVPGFMDDYPCLDEMAENSTFVNNLNAQKINIPYINIYGAEDAWPFVRLLSSQLNSKKVYDINNLDITYDEGGVNLLNDGLSVVNFVQDAHDVLYDIMSVISVVIWKYKSSKELVKQARYNWDDLYRYMQTDVHNDISKFNGSYKYERRTYCYEEWVSDGANNALQIYQDDYSEGHWEIVCHTSYVPVVLENDGMDSEESVKLPESMAGPNGKIINVRAPHVNHMEMGNHPEMRKIFEKAYSSDVYGQIFNLSK